MEHTPIGNGGTPFTVPSSVSTCSADFRTHLTASVLSDGTPGPSVYMMARHNWALASPLDEGKSPGEGRDQICFRIVSTLRWENSFFFFNRVAFTCLESPGFIFADALRSAACSGAFFSWI